MPNNKKTATIVVRPIGRDTDTPRKIILAPLKALNQHQPLKTLAPALVAPLAKPWKQPKSIPRIYRQHLTPATRAVGRTVGQEWCSDEYVCGAAIGPEWEHEARGAYETDVQEEWEREWARESQYDADEEDVRGPMEVHILDIAKPAKPRGAAKEYEVVETVRRVIALEDDDKWEEWEIGSEDELESDEWEALEDENQRHVSYAMVLQQSPD
ncbi:hypothetical protein LXA43DRAFT_1085489 [Ganoderma leucocontextum]|nr:hypothetical protein LXA43DRAFT_1085489 [Ganoderma leucocontextum]